MSGDVATELRIPPVVRSGPGAAEAVPDDARALGARRALVVTDRNVLGLAEVRGLLERLEAAGVGVAVFDDVPGEPTTREVAAGAAARRASGAAAVIAIGGGSAIDAGKAIAAMATNPGTIADYAGRDKLVATPLPLIAIATTAGTGSEVTRFAVITDLATDVKMLIRDDRLLPRVAVADPLLTMGMPRWVTASTGIDALTHAIEAYVSRWATPLSDIFALAAIRDISPSLLPAWERSDPAARVAMMRGSMLAGIAFSNASVALVHGMSRPIGALFHVPHGLSNAMLLPEVMAFSLAGAPNRFRDVAVALGAAAPGDESEAAGRRAVEAVASLCRALEVPRLADDLRARGADPARLRELAPRMAADALASGSPANNPRVPSAEEIVALYLRSL